MSKHPREIEYLKEHIRNIKQQKMLTESLPLADAPLRREILKKRLTALEGILTNINVGRFVKGGLSLCVLAGCISQLDVSLTENDPEIPKEISSMIDRNIFNDALRSLREEKAFRDDLSKELKKIIEEVNMILHKSKEEMENMPVY